MSSVLVMTHPLTYSPPHSHAEPQEQLLSKLLQETPRVVADDMLADAEASAPEPETITKFDLILDPYV